MPEVDWAREKVEMMGAGQWDLVSHREDFVFDSG